MIDVFDYFEHHEELLAQYAYEWCCEEDYSHMVEAARNEDRPGLIKAANDFWFHLPDNGSIRTRPFFVLCALAEEMFEDG